MKNIMRVRLVFEEATPEDLPVRSESYGARFLSEVTAEELAKFVSNTVLRNFPDFIKDAK